MNIQDYQWQTIQEGDNVIARPVNENYTGLSYKVWQDAHTYETLNLPSGQIIDGKELELNLFCSEIGKNVWFEILEKEIVDYDLMYFEIKRVLRPKTQPIEDKKELSNGHYHIIDAIVQNTLDCFIKNYIDERIKDVSNDVDIDDSNKNGRLRELKLINKKLPLIREDILKQLTTNQ